jgi:RND family efflux transporter MFP subunit
MSTRLPLAGAALVAAVLAFAALSGCDSDQGATRELPPRPVKAIKVADTEALTERTFPGRASAAKEVNLSFRVSGPLVGLPVNVGDEVQSGQELARIDPRDFEVKIETIRGKLEQAQATLAVAEREYERALGVQKRGEGLISESELDKRQGARNAAQASVRSLESALTSATDDLGYTHLKAPFDGVVVSTFVENFEDVIAKQPILRLLDPRSIEMTVAVPESLIGYAPHVKDVVVRFDALPETQVKARIKEIGREASQATRTYPVTLVMEQPETGEILPGMAGKAQILSELPDSAKETGLEIPAIALFTETGTDASFVWIIDEASKTLSKRQVQVGMPSRFGVLIRDGIEPGEWLVIAGVHSVKDGQEVRILDQARDQTKDEAASQ